MIFIGNGPRYNNAMQVKIKSSLIREDCGSNSMYSLVSGEKSLSKTI